MEFTRPLLAGLCLAATFVPAHAQESIADIFADRTVQLIVDLDEKGDFRNITAEDCDAHRN